MATAFIGLIAPSTAAQPPIVLTDATEHYPLSLHLEILEDETKQWSIDDVISPPIADQFQGNQQVPPNFGFTSSAIWVRFRIEDRSHATDWRLVLRASYMNHVALFLPDDQGGFEARATGNARPFSTRDVPYRLFQFRLPRSKDAVIYMRFENEAAMILPLEIWAQNRLEQKSQSGILGLGLFYGVLIALLGYNAFLLVSLRDPTYFFHILHLALSALCLASYDGLVQQYLWPWDRVLDPRLIVCLLLATTAAAMVFAISLLKTRTTAPIAHRVLLVLSTVAAVFTPLAFVFSYSTLARPAILFQLVAYVFTSWISWRVWRQGYRPARLFFAAWFLFSIGVSVLLTLTRVVPILPSAWFDVGLRIGTDGFFLLFSLALADRIHLVRNEKERAQAQLLNEQRESLEVQEAMNRALATSKNELEARNAELERYAYTVSHDLKAPVVTIKGFLGLLDKDLEAGNRERCSHHMERVNAAADTMGRLLDELLEMSRVGHVVGPKEEVDLSELARHAAELVSGSEPDLQLPIDIAPDMPTVSADRTRLLEVFQNLLENAVKYSRDQPLPHIEVSARTVDDHVVCSVRDNGIGIEPKYHETVFGLFSQLDPDGTGTGIGLALVKRIVEVHGGKIWVDSAGQGQGSTFQFTLPLQAT